MQIKNINILKNGGVGVFLTDTIYGVLGKALDHGAVERIYEIKSRDKNKPLIILISDYHDLELFDIKVGPELKKNLAEYWPGKVSIILPCKSSKFEYLHRGTNSLAFRYPKDKRIIGILRKTGPLVAPSANPQGKEPAESAEEAKKYFGEKVDFYESGKITDSKPSTLIKIEGGEITILRP